MGVFKTRVTVVGRRKEALEAVVEPGATLTALPADMLQELGFSAEFRQRFQFADGREEERPVGPAKLAIDGVEATVPVVFGSPGDALLPGATTLEVMGFAADPVARKLARTPACMLSRTRSPPTRFCVRKL
ncbi:MAG: Retroviral aspartyl protease [Halobacteria archaeon]